MFTKLAVIFLLISGCSDVTTEELLIPVQRNPKDDIVTPVKVVSLQRGDYLDRQQPPDNIKKMPCYSPTGYYKLHVKVERTSCPAGTHKDTATFRYYARPEMQCYIWPHYETGYFFTKDDIKMAYCIYYFDFEPDGIGMLAKSKCLLYKTYNIEEQIKCQTDPRQCPTVHECTFTLSAPKTKPLTKEELDADLAALKNGTAD